MKKAIAILSAVLCGAVLANEAVAVPIGDLPSGEAVAVPIGDLPSGEAVAVPIGDLNPNEVVATTLLADGSTNTWTQSDLRDALGLMNRMYHRDMATDAGRRKWHGDRIGEYLLPTGVTNAQGQAQMMMVHLYQDGFVATNKAVRYRRSIVADPEAAAKAAAEAKRRADEARAAWESANLPPDLAALRAAQRIAASTQTVTVVVGP